MSIALVSLLMLSTSSPAQLQLPERCTSGNYECVSAYQWPIAWAAEGFVINQSLHPEPPPLGTPYGPSVKWVEEGDMVAFRMEDAYIRWCLNGPPGCSVTYDGYGDWEDPEFDLGNGFVSRSNYRPEYFHVSSGPCSLGGNCWWKGIISAPIVCPVGWSGGGDDPNIGYYCYRAKQVSCPKVETCAGNPIDVFLKTKVQVESDWSSGLLRVERRYLSNGFFDAPAAGAGNPHPLRGFWRLNYERRVVEAMGASSLVANLSRDTGTTYEFIETAGSYIGNADTRGALKRLTSGGNPIGWAYESPAGELEIYDTEGTLQSIADRSGHSVALAYDAEGYLFSAVDERGRSLQYGYDNSHRLTSVTLPDGSLISYEYHPEGDPGINVWKVHFPGGATKTYNYEPIYGDPHLTSIVDENGIVYATFTYNSHGEPESSFHAGGVDLVSVIPGFEYAYDDALGVRHTFGVQTTANALRVTSESKGCAGCPTLSRTIHYDTAGNVDWTTDFNGNKTTFGYDPARFVETSRTEASTDTSPTSVKRTIQTDWHTTSLVPIERRTLNANSVLEAKTKWTYNTRGQTTGRCDVDPGIAGADTYVCGSATDAPTGIRQWTYAYCEQTDVTGGTCPSVGLLKSSNGPRLTTDAGMDGSDDVTTYTYYQTDDSTCASGGACPHRHGDLWKVTNALGQVTAYATYDKNGRVTRMQDANGTATDFQYHARGWLTDRIVRGNVIGSGISDATTHIDYDAVGNVTKVTQPDGAYLSHTYDDAHRLIKITDNLNNTIDYCPTGVGTADCLDAAGNRKIEQVKDPSNTIKRTARRVYDQLGRLQKVLNAASQTTFDATGGYDGNGNLVQSTDGLGYVTQQSYDGLNRLVKTLQNYNGIDPATSNTETDYTYDTRDNLRQVTDPDLLNTVYGYDGLNSLTSLSNPDTGSGSSAWIYTLDRAGNRTSQRDARNITSNYTYDALNRLISVTYPTTSLNTVYAYDQSNATTGCSTSFPIGRLTKITDGSGSTTFCYDRRGNVTKKTQITGSATLVTQYTYTKADRIASITYPSGNLVTYGRDVLGRVSSVSVKIGTTTTTLVGGTTYYPFGPLNVLTFGNGRALTKTYDQDYAIDQVSASVASGLSLDFAVDVMGNITDANNGARTYTYDPLYRLTASLKNGTAPAEQYTYNKTGDRLSAVLNAGSPTSYAYTPGTHRLASVGGVARTYDANGNTQTGVATGYTFNYDDKNRLAAAMTTSSSATYVTNGRGERVRKNVTAGSTITTSYSYDEGGSLLGEYSATGTAVAEYVYLDQTPIGIVNGTVVSYIETDHLGTPRQVINPTNNVVIWRWDFTANTFGNSPSSQDPDNNGVSFILNTRFPGQYYDAETGLHYNYKRDYESTTGRYVQSDPLGLDGGISTYSYALSRPLDKIDPSGMLSFGSTCSNIKRIQIAVALVDMGAELLKNACGSSEGGDGGCSSGHCMPCGQAKRILEWYLTSATIHCNLQMACGLTMPRLSTINMSLSGSYISTGRPEGCGCLSSTLLHEALHIDHEVTGTHGDDVTDENNTRRETRRCIPCARNDFTQ